MSHPGERSRSKGAHQGSPQTQVQARVSKFFYCLGLVCSSYPISVTLFSLVIIVSCSSPLIHIPLPFDSPQKEWVSAANLTDVFQPYCYVQQVVLRVAVLPWDTNLHRGDAFRAPLYEAFKVLDIVRNYQDEKNGKTLGHICLHIETVTRHKDTYNVMPQYSCLVLSPANFWHQDVHEFNQDSAIFSTIFNQHKFQKAKISVAEMLFGMRLRETGIKRHFDKEFIEGLQKKLTSTYPLFQNDTATSSNDTLVIKYPGEIEYGKVIPLATAFVLLFLYYYFYIRKVEEIKSKPLMAFFATFTVLCSFLMTLGLGTFFGCTVNNQGGKWVFPYLVILVSLENVLVLTKSVIVTPLHLDAKIRLAQGLSKEGWPTTKNLFFELTVFTMGFFTFVPAIQEFCIFAIIGLLCSLFLQISFFLTILGIDVTRATNSMDKTTQNFRNALYQPSFQSKGMSRSKSHPRLSFPTNVMASQKHQQEKKIPRRLRLVNIWARTRFFQRSFMIIMIIWIGINVYNTDLINNYIQSLIEDKHVVKTETSFERNYSNIGMLQLNMEKSTRQINYVTYSPLNIEKKNQSFNIDKLKPLDYSISVKLPSTHWSAILKKYNISVSGQSIAILPSIKLSHVVSPEQAILLRNPEEKYEDRFQWQALAIALDPIDFTGDDSPTNLNFDQPFYPRTPMEIVIMSILSLISVIVMTYAFVLLYRCVCSRNYAEWRASWYHEKGESESSCDEQVMLEAVPVVLEGHQQEVECMATDGIHLASACLGGQLKIWDNSTGELVAHINRKSHFMDTNFVEETNSVEDETLSDYESGSPPSRDEMFPRLVNRIKTDFSNLNEQYDVPSTSGFNSRNEFYKTYKYHYSTVEDGLKRRRNFVSDKELVSSSLEEDSNSLKSDSSNQDTKNAISNNRVSSVWCMDFLDNLIVIGCAGGRLEFWEASTGQLKCIFEDGNDTGITNVKIVGTRLIVAHLCGTLDLFQLQSYTQGKPVDWSFTCAYRRTHIRTGSMGSIPEKEVNNQLGTEELCCNKLTSIRAHQQSITCLDCEGGRIVTGSQDHLLKVHRIENGDQLYTLHGHCGPITCLFIDRLCTATCGSGSQDGMLCVWDLLSGACMYSIQAHDGCVISLTYSASYVISLGIDERLCVWERFQGHLLNTIFVGQVFSSHILMLASHLVVTGKNGGLVIWDVRNGECVRTISLGRDPFVFINHLILLHDAVLCDYGKQLRIVRFPLITHKFD